jgi:MbtH protein
MDTNTASQEPHYVVVANHEEQYSIWPADKQIPQGWHAAGPTGERQACLDHIAQVWTDMRPLSLRKQMAATSS